MAVDINLKINIEIASVHKYLLNTFDFHEVCITTRKKTSHLADRGAQKCRLSVPTAHTPVSLVNLPSLQLVELCCTLVWTFTADMSVNFFWNNIPTPVHVSLSILPEIFCLYFFYFSWDVVSKADHPLPAGKQLLKKSNFNIIIIINTISGIDLSYLFTTPSYD